MKFKQEDNPPHLVDGQRRQEEDMAEGEAENPEIEKFLLENLQSGIAKNRPYSWMFKKMKKSLEKQLQIATDRKEKLKIREKLFLLNNLMNEIDSNFDYLSWSRFRSLNQIKKEIKSAEKPGAAGRGVGNGTTAAKSERSTREMATKQTLGLDTDELAFRNLILYQSGSRCEDFNAIGIVGAEGVGKTTLAQSIFAQPEVKEQFLPRIWISLSEDLIDKDESLEIAIAKRILLSLGVSDETINSIIQLAAKDAEKRRNAAAATNKQPAQPSTPSNSPKKRSSIERAASKLTRSFTGMKDHEREKKVEVKAVEDSKSAMLAALIHAIRLELIGKRYLVVLDDASRMEDWYRELSLELTPAREAEKKLAFAFPKGSGGTVLVVGWPENIVEAMVGGDGSAIHRLLPLEDPKLCWDICKEAAGGDRGVIEDDKKVEDEVVKRANGLPMAARLMGMIKEELLKKRNQPTPITSTNQADATV